MSRRRRIAVVFALLLVLAVPAPVAAVDRTTIDDPFSERSLTKVYPGADDFSEPSGQYRTVGAYRQVDGERQLAGYVFLTSNVVDVEGYGDEPIEFLVALDTNGTIRGVELVEQHEPFFDRTSAIQRLRRFSYQMVGMSVTQDVTLRDPDGNEHHVDALTGASVTTRASIETVTRSARIVAKEKGIVSESALDDGSTNETATNQSSERRMTLGDLGRGAPLARWDAGAPDATAGSNDSLTLYAAPIESDPVKRSLFADRAAGPPDANATVLWVGLNAPGSASRPERLRLHQWTRSYAPPVHETRIDGVDWSAALAIEGTLDTASPFVLDLTVGGERLSRTYGPGGLAVRRPVDAVAARTVPAWVGTVESAWQDNWLAAAALVVFLTGIVGIFTFRSRISRRTGWTTNRLRIGTLGVTLAFIGWYHPTQPTTQQIAILVRELVSWATAGGFRWALFFSAPLVAITFICIALVIPKWGRGVFCGWICPFGALSELLYKLTPWEYELPREYHVKLEKLRYPLFVAIVIGFVISTDFGATLAKVEPFKAAFYSSLVTDPVYIAWSALLVVSGAFMFRPYCRYVCPLGAGLALGNVLQREPIQRYDLCGDCVKCQSDCEFQAIEDDGSIDRFQCFQCSVCVDNYYDPEGCPVVLQYDNEHGFTVDAWRDPALIERIRPEDRTTEQQRLLAERAVTDGGETEPYAGSSDLVPDGTVVDMVRRETAGGDAPGSDASCGCSGSDASCGCSGTAWLDGGDGDA
ncbi:4Fe-4S binding protein [Haloplanus rallus]|uniref:4Fe-4S binding protein n=1 Tax=Haloplanus rallus TaxID=1816183 RepID=A0A6B9FC02_9EURY|nr:4Fe-4S binding protein [Haloplanus rallus]QGX95981.1 4Fe-4S binding protein [Haloplanus rallus]